MTDVLANYGGNAALAGMVPTWCWLALHTAAPDVSGTPSHEFSGAGYTRQRVKFAAASGRTRVLATGAKFAGLPAGTVAYIGVWSAVSDGSFIWAKQLSPSIGVDDSGFFIVESGDLAVSL